jgi:hypothetical protein
MSVKTGIQKSVLAGLLVLPVVKGVPHEHLEKWYQQRWCDAHNGEMEVVLPDNTRCDCVTATHAIEFDFGEKWAESIGQSLYYGLQTGKTPGVVLILEEEKDDKYWLRLNTTVEHYDLPIDTWSTSEDDLIEKSRFEKVSSWLHLLLKGE